MKELKRVVLKRNWSKKKGKERDWQRDRENNKEIRKSTQEKNCKMTLRPHSKRKWMENTEFHLQLLADNTIPFTKEPRNLLQSLS